MKQTDQKVYKSKEVGNKPSPHHEAWAERFDKRFRPEVPKQLSDDFFAPVGTMKDIKSFIRKELTTLHKADCERFRGMLKPMKEDHIVPESDDHWNCTTCERNDVINELLTALQKFEEEE